MIPPSAMASDIAETAVARWAASTRVCRTADRSGQLDAVREVVQREAGSRHDQDVGPGHHRERGGAEDEEQHAGRPRGAPQQPAHRGRRHGPDGRRAERDRQDDAVHRRAVVPPAGEVGEPHRPEQLAHHQAGAAHRGQQQHQAHRPVGDRQPHRLGHRAGQGPRTRDQRRADGALARRPLLGEQAHDRGDEDEVEDGRPDVGDRERLAAEVAEQTGEESTEDRADREARAVRAPSASPARARRRPRGRCGAPCRRTRPRPAPSRAPARDRARRCRRRTRRTSSPSRRAGTPRCAARPRPPRRDGGRARRPARPWAAPARRPGRRGG